MPPAPLLLAVQLVNAEPFPTVIPLDWLPPTEQFKSVAFFPVMMPSPPLILTEKLDTVQWSPVTRPVLPRGLK